jgi:hypothetical protein
VSENKPPSVVSVRLAFIGTLNLPTHFMKQHSHHLLRGAIIIIRVLKLTGVSLGAAFLHTFRMSRWTTCIHQKNSLLLQTQWMFIVHMTFVTARMEWVRCYDLSHFNTRSYEAWHLFGTRVRINIPSPCYRPTAIRIEFRLSIYMHFTCLAPLTQRRSC